MIDKFAVRQSLDEAQSEGRRSRGVLTGAVLALVMGTVGVGVGVAVTHDDPASLLAAFSAGAEADTPPSAAAQIEAVVARAATTEFNTGIGQPEPVVATAPAPALQPDAMASLVERAVQESAEASGQPLGTVVEDATVQTAALEDEVDAAPTLEPGDNSNLFARPANADPQCFVDLQNLTRDARVYFPSGGTTVDESGIAQARLIGLVAQTCPGVIVQVEGHSDPSGDPAVNLVLSERRAGVVVDRIAASGIDTSMFRAVGFGDRVGSNITGPESDAYYDRRVEFSVVKSGVAATSAAVAASAALPACVVQMQNAVDQTRVFYRPNSITASQTDLAPVFQLAATAAACPDAKLRVIGHYAEGEGDGETFQTGRMRAVAMMSMIVASGFDAEEVIIAAPSSPTLMGPQGINNRRVDFDVIYDPN